MPLIGQSGCRSAVGALPAPLSSYTAVLGHSPLRSGFGAISSSETPRDAPRSRREWVRQPRPPRDWLASCHTMAPLRTPGHEGLDESPIGKCHGYCSDVAAHDPTSIAEKERFALRLATYDRLKPDFGIPFSRMHIRRLVNAGRFPAPIRVGGRSIAWLTSELDAYISRAADARAPDPANDQRWTDAESVDIRASAPVKAG